MCTKSQGWQYCQCVNCYYDWLQNYHPTSLLSPRPLVLMQGYQHYLGLLILTTLSLQEYSTGAAARVSAAPAPGPEGRERWETWRPRAEQCTGISRKP